MTDTIERGMFYGVKPHIFKKAEQLRRNMTKCETLLWKRINDKKILWCRFKAQHPIDIFIADFYCHALQLVVELDGEIHNNRIRREYDIGRTAELERFEIKVIRYSNDEVLNDIEKVIYDIMRECKIRKDELGDSPPRWDEKKQYENMMF